MKHSITERTEKLKLWIWKCKKKLQVGVCFLFFVFLITACDKKPQKLTLTDTAMGTVVQETLYVADLEKGQETAKKLLEKLEHLEEEKLSWRMEGAEVEVINNASGAEEGFVLSEEMTEYLEQIWEISQVSDGALDVTVGKVTRLWDLDTWAVADRSKQESFQEPNVKYLQELLQNTGYEKVILEEGRIFLPKGISLDLGAVGKGIACDEIGAYLVSQELIKGAVISVGGSIVTYGSKPDGSAWNVAIMHPREEGAYLGTLSLQGEWYVSTSGDYERFVEKNGVRYHHIINPENGYPANSGVCSVTIMSDNGLLSDALSTACFVLGVEKGLELAEKYKVEALFVTQELELFMTEGMERYFVKGDW